VVKINCTLKVSNVKDHLRKGTSRSLRASVSPVPLLLLVLARRTGGDRRSGAAFSGSPSSPAASPAPGEGGEPGDLVVRCV